MLSRGVEISGRESGLSVNGLKLDWSPLAEAPVAVVIPFDPRDDREA